MILPAALALLGALARTPASAQTRHPAADLDAIDRGARERSGIDERTWNADYALHAQEAVSLLMQRKPVEEAIGVFHARPGDEPKIEAYLAYYGHALAAPEFQDHGPSAPTPAGAIPATYGPPPAVVAFRENLDAFETKRNPNDGQAWASLGQDQYWSRDFPGAVGSYGRAIQLGVADEDTLRGYGRSAYFAGDYQLAAQAARLAHRMDPGDKDALLVYEMSKDRISRVNLPSVLSAVGNFGPSPGAGAAASADGAGGGAAGPSQTPEQIAAQINSEAAAPPGLRQQSIAFSDSARSRLQIDDNTGARQLATQAIGLDARNTDGWAYRAIAENRLGLFPASVSDASVALGLAPGNSVALQTRSWALAKQGRFQEALADANYSLEHDPNSVAYYNRAFALAGLGDADGSLDSLKQAAAMDARFRPQLERALAVPDKSDLLLVFDQPAAGDAGSAAGPAQSRPARFARLVLFTASGGLLFALGFLNIFSESWRKRVQATVRRALGSSASPAAPPAQQAPPASGDGFWGQFALARPIGSGGMGVVYEATDRSLGRRVAIKRMRDEIRCDPIERQHFVAEARTVAALHHPNIVDIYSIVEEGPEVYLVFEFVDGQTIAQRLKDKGPFSFDEALRVLRGAAAAVDYAHGKKVIHRDLKNSNLMLTAQGQVKVMDFGVARQAQEALTRTAYTNTVVGTPPYMAPEQEQGTVRPESDVFSLAVCFYEMLTGGLPFEGVGAGMLLNKINGKHVPPSHRVPSLPAGLDRVFAKAFVPEAGVRYRTAAELLAAVEGVAAARAASGR